MAGAGRGQVAAGGGSRGGLRRALVFATEALDPLAGLSQRAEAAGFHRVYTTEYLGRDAVARAIAIAAGTERIEVATGIAYAFTRPPLAMAALAADAQRLSHGRFALGVGAGVRGVRRWYGVEGFDPPAPAMEDFAGQVREAFARDAALDAPPPLCGAALNPVMARYVTRAFDETLVHALGLARVHLRERLMPAVRRGAADRGGEAKVAMWVITSIADDPAEAIDRAKRQLAFYLSTPTYGAVLEGAPYAQVADDVRSAFKASEHQATWTELARLVPDEAVDELALAGTPADVRDQASELEGRLEAEGITELAFQTVGADITGAELIDNCEQIIEHLGGRTA